MQESWSAIPAGTREEARCGNLSLCEPPTCASLITQHGPLCLQHSAGLAQAGSRKPPTISALSLRQYQLAQYAVRPPSPLPGLRARRPSGQSQCAHKVD